MRISFLQLPQAYTDLLDDKRELQLTLEAASLEYLAPETYVDVDCALLWPTASMPERNFVGMQGDIISRMRSSDSCASQESWKEKRACEHSTPIDQPTDHQVRKVVAPDILPHPLACEGQDTQDMWVLKHRRGVKGQGVTPIFSAHAARELIAKLPAHRRADFVLQRVVREQTKSASLYFFTSDVMNATSRV